MSNRTHCESKSRERYGVWEGVAMRIILKRCRVEQLARLLSSPGLREAVGWEGLNSCSSDCDCESSYFILNPWGINKCQVHY